MAEDKNPFGAISLSEWISALRAEIAQAVYSRKFQQQQINDMYGPIDIPNFSIKKVSVELETAVSRSSEAGVSAKFWVLTGDAKAKIDSKQTQKIKFDIDIENLLLGSNENLPASTKIVSIKPKKKR